MKKTFGEASKEFHDAVVALGNVLAKELKIPQLVEWLDRGLRWFKERRYRVASFSGGAFYVLYRPAWWPWWTVLHENSWDGMDGCVVTRPRTFETFAQAFLWVAEDQGARGQPVQRPPVDRRRMP